MLSALKTFSSCMSRVLDLTVDSLPLRSISVEGVLKLIDW